MFIFFVGNVFLGSIKNLKCVRSYFDERAFSMESKVFPTSGKQRKTSQRPLESSEQKDDLSNIADKDLPESKKKKRKRTRSEDKIKHGEKLGNIKEPVTSEAKDPNLDITKTSWLEEMTKCVNYKIVGDKISAGHFFPRVIGKLQTYHTRVGIHKKLTLDLDLNNNDVFKFHDELEHANELAMNTWLVAPYLR